MLLYYILYIETIIKERNMSPTIIELNETVHEMNRLAVHFVAENLNGVAEADLSGTLVVHCNEDAESVLKVLTAAGYAHAVIKEN